MTTIKLKGLNTFEQGALPPVHLWAPELCGDLDLVIKSNGDWVHEGGKISRPAMVRMFSRILWFENGDYFLVTPVEKVRIQVEDAPFLVTEWRWLETDKGQTLELQTLTQDTLQVGVDSDLWLESYKGEERPYVSMRYGMKALISRNVFYALMDELQSVENELGRGVGIISAGKSYLLMKDE